MFTPAMFDLVISLGHRCQTAQNLRRMMIHSGTMPFDWIISSTGGVAEAIETDFDGVFRPERLELRDDCVIDHRFGFAYLHDFPICADFLAAHTRVCRRQDLLIRRFRAALASDARILFVRQESAGTDGDAVRRLAEALARRRAAFHLLVLSEADSLPPRPGAENVTLICTGPQFADAAARWDAVFNLVHRNTPIRAYFPRLVRAAAKAPPKLRGPIQKLIGTSRRRLMQLTQSTA